MSKPPFSAIALFIGSVTAPVAAQTPSTVAQPVSFVGELVSIVVPLAFIILVLIAVLHLARRRYGISGQDAPLSVVQVLALGPRERIVLVRTRTGRVFAVGVGAQSVTLLTDLDPAELTPKSPPESDPDAATARPKVFGRSLIPRDLFGSQRRGPGAPP